MKLLIAISSALIAVITATSHHFGERIVGGDVAWPGQFPYQAGISFTTNNGESNWCGGSILSKGWILTAAHCVYNIQPDVTVYVGITNRMFAYVGQEFKITNPDHLIYHEDYDPKMIRNDIGLIKLSRSIHFNSNVQPIALVKRTHAHDQFVGRKSVASGWGKTKDSDQVTSIDLHYVDLTPITNTECKKTFGDFLTDDNICVATGGKSICSGDSGGPLVTIDTHEQIGINSFVSGGGCEGDEPAVLVRVTNFLDWIKKHTGLNV